MLGLDEESVLVWKRACRRVGTSITVSLAVVPVFFRADRERADISSIRHDYEEYRCLTLHPKSGNGVDLDTLFDQDQL